MKKFRTKKNIKKYLYIIIFIFIFYMIIGSIFNGRQINIKNMLLKTSLNEYIKEKNILLNLLDVNIITPKNIIYASLNKSIDSSNIFDSYEEDDFNYEDASSEYVEDPNPIQNKDPLVYIYNTHQLESYSMKVKNDYNIKPNVMIPSYIIKEKLNEKNISTIVETANIKKYLNKNNLSYSKSYTASRYYLKEAMKKNSTLKYYIDIHRDSAKIENTLYKKDNKEYARILFVVGMEHKNKNENLEFVKQLNNIINESYPGISRGIAKKSGNYVNGIYNQDLSNRVILIEVGGLENEIEQVYNTCEVIANALEIIIKEENNGN